MNQKNNQNKERKFGTKKVEKKPLIDPRYKNLFYTVLTIVVIAVFFIINNSKSEPQEGPYPPNYKANNTGTVEEKAAPDFELTNLEGKKIKLSDYKGKVVILDFWATWCAPCRKGIPDLVDLKNAYKAKGVEVIGISLDQDNTIADVKPFVKEYKINYPVVFGNMDVVQKYGNIQAIPTTFIINKEGKISATYQGLVDKSVFETHLNKLTAKQS